MPQTEPETTPKPAPEKPRPRNYTVTVEAMRWDPADPEGTGRFVAWLQMTGIEFEMASARTIRFTAEAGGPILEPGQWVAIDPSGRFAVLTDEHFTAADYAPEPAIDANEAAVVCERLGHYAHLHYLRRPDCAEAHRVLAGLARHRQQLTEQAAGR
jgi:hypothetical protein